MNSRADSLPAELRLGQPGEVHEAGGELGMTPMMRRSKTGDGPVDVDPSWYPGQPETSPLGMMNGEAAPAAAGAAALQAPLVLPGPAEDHVPTVLTKLQKWGDYESVGLGPVAPSRFIPMKTPLSRAILADWSLPQAPRHRLTVPELLEEQRAAGRQCGLLLDLSNHECLYGEDVPEGVAYQHVSLVAKELPPLEFVWAVRDVANAFWAEHPDQFICVHCAYGFNRTGFVVASYLIEEFGLSVDAALAAFAAARPPGVKHERFREELHARYDPPRGPLQLAPLLAPQQPGQQQQQRDDGQEFLSPPGDSPSGRGHAMGASPPAGCAAHAAGATGPSPIRNGYPMHVMGARSIGRSSPVLASSHTSPLAARLLVVGCGSPGSGDGSDEGDNSSIGCSPNLAPDMVSLVPFAHRASLASSSAWGAGSPTRAGGGSSADSSPPAALASCSGAHHPQQQHSPHHYTQQQPSLLGRPSGPGHLPVAPPAGGLQRPPAGGSEHATPSPAAASASGSGTAGVVQRTRGVLVDNDSFGKVSTKALLDELRSLRMAAPEEAGEEEGGGANRELFVLDP